MTNNKTIYLIDGTAYIHRAYHAIRGLANSKGLPTNAIYPHAYKTHGRPVPGIYRHVF